MRNYRLAGVLGIIIMLAFSFASTVLYEKGHRNEIHNLYIEPLPAAPKEEYPLQYIREDFSVTEDFTSHLPLVILDTNGVEPPINTYFNQNYENTGMGIYVPIPDVDPYVEGTVRLLNSDDGGNRVTDEPEITCRMRIKRRGNTSMYYEKAQWLIKLTTESGQDQDVDLLGMGAEHEWILNGSMYDKSMLRNYLSYSLASEILPYTPDSRFCEVLIKNGESYVYQGVYLLCENIKQGKDRVNIAEYRKSETFNSYLVRRDRYDEEALLLENFGRLNGYSSEYLSLLYPSKRQASDDMAQYVNQDINRIEKILYSDNTGIFATYGDVIDVDSFINYFLINEYLGNYDAGNNSTYFYKDLGGKLCMGPVWDYDGAIDNYIYEPLETESLAFYTKPWFDRLCTDRNFIYKLERRYTKLRHGTLSDQKVIGKIDEIITHLGGAQKREWARWGSWYTTENRYSLLDYETEDGTILHRNAVTYEDEIYRIKAALRDHGDRIPKALRKLEDDAAVKTGLASWMGWLLILAAAAFIIPAVYVSYEK